MTVEGERVRKDLYLERQGLVEGTVLTPVGSAGLGPFAPSNTVLYQDGRLVGATLDNPFHFDGVIAGRDFELRSSEPGGKHVARGVGRVLSQGQLLRLDLRMFPIGSAVVRVETANGLPVPVPT